MAPTQSYTFAQLLGDEFAIPGRDIDGAWWEVSVRGYLAARAGCHARIRVR